MPLSRRVSVRSVSDKVVQTYKFVRRPSTRSAREVPVTSPTGPTEVEDNQSSPPTTTITTTTTTTTTTASCEAEPQTSDQMYGYNEHFPQQVETVDIMRATPADPSSITRKSSRNDLLGKINGHAYYNDAFALREEGKKVPSAAAVWVEMKTNVILENEFEFIKSLSQVIAKRYSRTEETVALSVQHSSCMIMGGTFDGCYFMTITSPVSVSPTCNKRNVALISEWLSTNLGVPSSRGYIRFVEPDVANYAMGGVTCLDMLEKERSSTRMSMANPDGNSNGGKVKRGFLSGRTSRMERLDENRPPLTPVDSIDSGSDTLQSTYAEKQAAMKKGKSMFQIFGRSQRIPA